MNETHGRTCRTAHGRALFYTFVTADSDDAENLPVTLWLNGGPGCPRRATHHLEGRVGL